VFILKYINHSHVRIRAKCFFLFLVLNRWIRKNFGKKMPVFLSEFTWNVMGRKEIVSASRGAFILMTCFV